MILSNDLLIVFLHWEYVPVGHVKNPLFNEEYSHLGTCPCHGYQWKQDLDLFYSKIL